MTKAKDMLKKMCVIGESSVGKTSLIRRFVIDKFDDKYIATIGTKTSKKTLTMRDDGINVNLKLIIWDILGQRSFAELKKSAYKGASGAFIVLDLTRLETLHSFKIWLSSLYEVTGEIPVVVLANKCDLEREFGEDEIEKLVNEYGFPYYLTSAKTGENVNEGFYALGKMMIKSWKEKRNGQHLKIPETTESKLEVEIEPDKRYTALEVEDIIMTRYCALLEDPEIAMAIVREQFKRLGLDFMNPTPEGLAMIVDYMIEAASNQVEATRLEKEKRTYTNLIRKIEREMI